MSDKSGLVAFINATNNTKLRRLCAAKFLCGYANGYVAVPPTHPCCGMDIDEIGALVDVHGGVTLSSPAIYPSGPFIDPAYAGKRVSVLDGAEYMDADNSEVPDDWWIVGFDTCHHDDSILSWNRDRVAEETLNLMAQLQKLGEK